MRASYALLGEPERVGMMSYLLILLASPGGLVFVVVFIVVLIYAESLQGARPGRRVHQLVIAGGAGS